MPFIMVEKTPYSPLVSSPLNPESCYEIPRKNARRIKALRLNGRKIPSPVSPTQRLLRQKAETAWRSQKGHFFPRGRPMNDSLDITMSCDEPQTDGRGLGGQNVRVRIDIDRAAVVTVISMPMDGKGLQPTASSTFHDDQEGLCQVYRPAAGIAARKILWIIALLCVVGLVTAVRLQMLLRNPPMGP